MVLKIEKLSDEPNTVFRLSGRIKSEHVPGLKAQIGGITHTRRVALDLEEVRVVDLDAVHFLAVCETKGIELRHCPGYVRQWIIAEKGICGLECG